MKLQNNPFFILKLTCGAGRREIISAVEELSLLTDSETCLYAQNELINLGKRLHAELDWFIELDKEQLRNIQERVENGEEIQTDELNSLSKLNATLYNFTLSLEDDIFELGYAILDIDEQYSNLNTDEITNNLNNSRSAAKIALASEKDVSEEINNKRFDIRQIISGKLSVLDRDAYIELVTMLAEKYIVDEDYEDGIILSDVVDQYEVQMQSNIEESTERIEKHITHIQQLVNDDAINENVNTLIHQVQIWDKMVQPLQLKSQASGMSHAISEQLGIHLRNLALYLHNEKSKTKEALTLVDAMKDVFAELGDFFDLFDSDADALNDLLQGEKDAKEIVAELEAIQKQAESLKSFALNSSIDSFIDRVRKLDAKIKTIDLDLETRAKIRENLCYIAREAAIELHNTNHLTAYALMISKALVSEFGDVPSLRLKLNEDTQTLSQQLSLPNRPLYSSIASSSSSTNSSNYGCLIAIVLFVIIAIIIAVASGGNSSSSNDTSSTNKSSYSSTNNATDASLLTVQLDKCGGSGGSSSVQAKKDYSMPYANSPSKSGYSFMGYYASENGTGTRYYDEKMNSVHSWDKSAGGTIYAYWVEADGSITLTPTNFEDYFTVATDAEFINNDVTVTYSIFLKDSTYKNGKNASDVINVDMGVVVSILQYTYGDPTYNKKQRITLSKSNNYSASGTITFSYSSFTDTVYWRAEITSCSGKIEK